MGTGKDVDGTGEVVVKWLACCSINGHGFCADCNATLDGKRGSPAAAEEKPCQ